MKRLDEPIMKFHERFIKVPQVMNLISQGLVNGKECKMF